MGNECIYTKSCLVEPKKSSYFINQVSTALLYEEDWRITNENSRMSKDELMVDAKKSRKSNLPHCLPLFHQEIEVVRTHNAYQIGTSTTSMSSTNRGGHAQAVHCRNDCPMPRFITTSNITENVLIDRRRTQ